MASVVFREADRTLGTKSRELEGGEASNRGGTDPWKYVDTQTFGVGRCELSQRFQRGQGKGKSVQGLRCIWVEAEG